jgi:hypothetical protein
MIPNRFKVKNRWIEVSYQHGLIKGDAVGLWEPSTNRIIISADIEPHQAFEVFIHELLHCLSDLYDLKISETKIEKIDGPLSRILWESITS